MPTLSIRSGPIANIERQLEVLSPRDRKLLVGLVRTEEPVKPVKPANPAVYRAAQELRLAVPQRLSVLSVADLDFATIMSPPLTTIRQDGYAIGRQADALCVRDALNKKGPCVMPGLVVFGARVTQANDQLYGSHTGALS